MLVRRAALAAVAAAFSTLPSPPAHAQKADSSAMRVTWGPFKNLSPEEMDRLSDQSKLPDAGQLLPTGIRVIDLVVGDGPQPKRGDRIYAHYKVWANGFRSGPAADISFLDNRPCVISP